MLVSKKPWAPNARPSLSNTTPSLPNVTLQSTQREPVEYSLHWACTFHVVCVPFSALGMRKLPNANAASGGIQA